MEGSPRKLIWGVPSCFTMLSDLWITIAHLLIISMILQVLTASAPATVEVGSDGEHMLTEDDPALLASPIEIGYFTTKTLQAAVRLWCMPRTKHDALRKYGPISEWNTSRVTNMFSLFYEFCSTRSTFNDDISGWQVSRVQEMSYMFHKCIRFNQDLTRWDVSSVTNMEGMFQSASAFDHPLNTWNISRVTSLQNTFRNARSFDKSLSRWDVSSVTNMRSIFWGASKFNRPMSRWRTSNVVDMQAMFVDAIAFNQGIGEWDVSAVKNKIAKATTEIVVGL